MEKKETSPLTTTHHKQPFSLVKFFFLYTTFKLELDCIDDDGGGGMLIAIILYIGRRA